MSPSRLQFSPSGAAYVAGAARKAGHTVEVFDCYVASELIDELKEKLSEFCPDVIGISITFVTGDILDEESEFGTKYFDMRPKIRRIVDNGDIAFYRKNLLDKLNRWKSLRDIPVQKW